MKPKRQGPDDHVVRALSHSRPERAISLVGTVSQLREGSAGLETVWTADVGSESGSCAVGEGLAVFASDGQIRSALQLDFRGELTPNSNTDTARSPALRS